MMLDLKAKRKSMGLTQFELAVASGVSLPSIQKLETGRGNPSLNTLISLGHVLGFTLIFHQTEQDWEFLRSVGLPIAGETPKIPEDFSTMKLVTVIRRSIDSAPEGRLRDALWGLILAIKRYFPGIWGQHFPDLKIPEDLDENRLLKLSRLAASRLCHCL